MPIMLFNPPCPHADPVGGGVKETHGLNPCGSCVCVARYYEMLAGDDQGTGYPGLFAGRHVLKRNLAAYRLDDQELCNWFGSVPPPPEGLLSGGNSYPYGWALYYLDSVRGWECRAAGQSYVGDAPPQDVAFYTLRAPGHAQTMFKCLEPTTFWLDSNFGSPQALGNLPASIIIQPFWP